MVGLYSLLSVCVCVPPEPTEVTPWRRSFLSGVCCGVFWMNTSSSYESSMLSAGRSGSLHHAQHENPVSIRSTLQVETFCSFECPGSRFGSYVLDFLAPWPLALIAKWVPWYESVRLHGKGDSNSQGRMESNLGVVADSVSFFSGAQWEMVR